MSLFLYQMAPDDYALIVMSHEEIKEIGVI